MDDELDNYYVTLPFNKDPIYNLIRQTLLARPDRDMKFGTN